MARIKALKKRYPNVKGIRIDATESTCGDSPRQPVRLTGDDSDFRVSCNEPQCNNGGFDFEWIVEDMILAKQTYKKDVLQCEGHKYPADQALPCMHIVNYEIHIEYAEQKTMNQSG